MRKNGYYWMAVTPDEYEMPLAVAESSRELAGMLGVHIGTILSCEARHRTGRNTGKSPVRAANPHKAVTESIHNKNPGRAIITLFSAGHKKEDNKKWIRKRQLLRKSKEGLKRYRRTW